MFPAVGSTSEPSLEATGRRRMRSSWTPNLSLRIPFCEGSFPELCKLQGPALLARPSSWCCGIDARLVCPQELLRTPASAPASPAAADGKTPGAVHPAAACPAPEPRESRDAAPPGRTSDGVDPGEGEPAHLATGAWSSPVPDSTSCPRRSGSMLRLEAVMRRLDSGGGAQEPQPGRMLAGVGSGEGVQPGTRAAAAPGHSGNEVAGGHGAGAACNAPPVGGIAAAGGGHPLGESGTLRPADGIQQGGRALLNDLQAVAVRPELPIPAAGPEGAAEEAEGGRSTARCESPQRAELFVGHGRLGGGGAMGGGVGGGVDGAAGRGDGEEPNGRPVQHGVHGSMAEPAVAVAVYCSPEHVRAMMASETSTPTKGSPSPVVAGESGKARGHLETQPQPREGADGGAPAEQGAEEANAVELSSTGQRSGEPVDTVAALAAIDRAAAGHAGALSSAAAMSAAQAKADIAAQISPASNGHAGAAVVDPQKSMAAVAVAACGMDPSGGSAPLPASPTSDPFLTAPDLEPPASCESDTSRLPLSNGSDEAMGEPVAATLPGADCPGIMSARAPQPILGTQVRRYL